MSWAFAAIVFVMTMAFLYYLARMMRFRSTERPKHADETWEGLTSKALIWCGAWQFAIALYLAIELKAPGSIANFGAAVFLVIGGLYQRTRVHD